MTNLTILNDAPQLMDLLPTLLGDKERITTQTWHCFNSPEVLTRYLQQRASGDFWDRAWRSQYDRGFCDFSLEQTYNAALDGWQEGAERARKLAERIAVNVPTTKRLMRYGVAGALPDIPRYLAGNPANMKRISEIASRRRPVITLLNHMGGLASVNAACFINRAALVAGIVDAIENAGYSVHVVGLAQSRERSYLCGTLVTIKEPGDVLDLSRLAFALGHVAMFRRLVFGVRSSDRCNSSLGSSMGQTADFKTSAPTNCYLLPSMNVLENVLRTEELAETTGLDRMLETLKEQDCPAFREAGGEEAA